MLAVAQSSKKSATTKAPAKAPAVSASVHDSMLEAPIPQRKTCPCGGGCPRCLSLPSNRGTAPAHAAVWETLSRSTVSNHRVSPSGPGSDARIHTDLAAAQGASALGALAVTIGKDIYFGRDRYAPHTAEGAHLLRHELAHVGQAPRDLRHDPARGIEIAGSDHPAEREAARIAHLGGAPSYRATSLVAFRLVAPTPAVRRTSIQILGNPAAAALGMTLAQFKEYTVAQADWFVEPTLQAGTIREDLWRVLLIAQEGPHILSGVGDVQVSDLIGVSAADWTPLRAFCRGTHSSEHTVRIFPPLPPLADRIALGRTLIGLEAIIPPAQLETTVSQVQTVQLQTQALLPVLTTYWMDYQPFLEETFIPTAGAKGPEFERVLVFLNALGAQGLVPLVTLKGANPDERWVRNLHRFPLPMLLRLVVNLTDTSGVKRLVLLLHTGHDAPGAFQNSANLFSDLVLNSPHNLVLMIEGATSLAAITARIPAITNTWGQKVAGVRRISQLLIAGHGSDQTVSLAGTVAEESLVANTPTTQILLDALLTHMDPAQARILYAGCLVGATDVAAGTPAGAIPGALLAQQSLGAFTEARAAAAGIPAGRVQAARASVALGAATSLTEPSGKLKPAYAFDPNAFGSASDYARSGHEPEGVLRAAVEVGGRVDTKTAEHLLRTRLDMPAVPGDWYDTITRLVVGLALPPVAVPPTGVNLQTVNELANVAEIPFLIRWMQFNIVPAHFVNRLNPQPFAPAIYAGMALTTSYTAPVTQDEKRLRIVVDQGWLALVGAAKAPAFLAGILTTGLAANAFEDFLDLAVLAPQGATLLPPAGAPTTEQIRLALAWFKRDGANADVRSFLTAQVLHPAGAPAAFSPAVSAEIAAAGRTDREILDQLGFAPAAVGAAPVGGGPPPSLANLALPGSATNTLLVSGRPYLAQVIAAPNAKVRVKPDVASAVSSTLLTGASVRVTGSTGGWSAVDVGGHVGFIRQTDISPPPP